MAAESIVTSLSNGFADLVGHAAPSVIQVHGRRRPASGIVYGENIVVTTGRALGREDGLHVRRSDGAVADAELVGWDPTTSVAVLRTDKLGASALVPTAKPARVGHLAVAIARSWSNAVTASVGNIAVIGGPLATGRHRAIEEVIRTSAPMHEGFAGGAFIDTDGGLLGLTTAATIRGFGVVIPARIVWSTAATLVEHGGLKRGFLGIAGQPAALPEHQRQVEDREEALLVMNVTSGSPAAQGGLLVGDLLLDFDGQPIRSPEDLLELLIGDRVGRAVPLRVLRGTSIVTLTVTAGERPGR